MGYDLYLRKVNKKGLQDKLRYHVMDDLSYDDIEEITEDEINSFLNVFEKYFIKNEIFYKHDIYYEISSPEFDSMMLFLEKETALSRDINDWDYKMAKMVYDSMKLWRNEMTESSILFEHDC